MDLWEAIDLVYSYLPNEVAIQKEDTEWSEAGGITREAYNLAALIYNDLDGKVSPAVIKVLLDRINALLRLALGVVDGEEERDDNDYPA